MTNLHSGQVDQASRAAAAILPVHRGCVPRQIDRAVDAMLSTDVGFRATSNQRWERYAACIDRGLASTNRQ